MTKEPVMIFDKEAGKYTPLFEYITRVMSIFKVVDTTVEFDIELERYGCRLRFSIPSGKQEVKQGDEFYTQR